MMTGKPVLWIVLALLCTGSCFAQQNVRVELNQRPVNELFESIELQSDLRIFYTSEALDSMLVSVSCTDKDPLELLRETFRNTGYQVSSFHNHIFILKDQKITTSLSFGSPDVENEKAEVTPPVSVPVEPLTPEKQEQKTVSEQKIHEIGNAGLPAGSNVTLTGYVTDSKTGQPLPGISVFIENPRIGVVTDPFGYYSIQLPPGRQELNIQSVGMKNTKRQLLLHSDGKLNIELREEVYAIGEVVVNAAQTNNIRTTALGVERLQMKNVKNVPTVFGESDILRIVMSLPGVKSAGEVSSGFNVRGGATDQNLILFDDGTIYNPTHLFGVFSAFNPDIIKDMELYKSSIPAKYGGRISSVLDINSREGSRKKFQGSASIGLLTGRLSLEGPLFSEKTSFLLGGRTTYSNWLLKQIPEGKNGYSKGNAGFSDVNGTIAHHFDGHNHLYIHGYYSQDRFGFNEYENYAYRNANASGKWNHIFTPEFTGAITVGYDHYDYSMDNTEYAETAYLLDFKMNQEFGKMDFSWFPNDRHKVQFGLSTIHYNFSPGNYRPNDDESLVIEDHIPHEKALESAVYLGDEWELTPRFSVNAGIRYSFFNVLGPRTYNTYLPNYLPSEETISAVDSANGVVKTYHGPEFRFSARYAFSDQLSVKAGINTMRQYIHKISNTTIMSPTDIWKLSDGHILPQNGMQIAAGVFKNFSADIETSAELYYKTMNNYMDYRPGAELIMNHHIETEVVSTEGKSYGLELMLKKTQGKLNGWVSYTYSRTMLRQSDPMIVYPVNGGRWYPADFDKPHEMKFVGNYKFTRRYSVSMNCDYSTGKPVTIPVAKYMHAGGQYVYYTERNQLRVPDFFRVDLSFNVEPSHHLTLLTHSSFSFGVYNLTGRNNVYSVYYVADKGVVKGYKLAIFGAPLPYVSYNIKF